jgi:hypothetical protein
MFDPTPTTRPVPFAMPVSDVVRMSRLTHMYHVLYHVIEIDPVTLVLLVLPRLGFSFVHCALREAYT